MALNEKASKKFVNDMDSFSEKRRPSFEPGKTENLMSQYISAASAESVHTDFLKKELPESGAADKTISEKAEHTFRKQMQGVSAREYQKQTHDSVPGRTDREDVSAYPGSGGEKTTFSSYTDTGGGAVFRTQRQEGSFSNSKVQLNSFKNRTDKQTFKDKAAHFMDVGGRTFEAVKPEENEAAASTIDDKAILATIVLHEKALDEKKRLKDIRVEKKDEVKHLQQIVRKEQMSRPDNMGFSGSSAEFTDKNERFLNKYLNAFKEKNLDIFGNGMQTNVSSSVINEQTRQGAAAALRQKEAKIDDRREKVSAFSNESSFDKKNELNVRRSDAELDENVMESRGEEKFSKTTVKADDNKEKKAVDSYFSKDSGSESIGNFDRLSNKEKLELKKSEQKAAKKTESQATKRAAAIAAVSNMLMAKKELQNLAGNMNSTGNLLKDGSGGMVQAAVSGIKSFIANKTRGLFLKIVSAILGGLLHILTMATPLVFVVVFVIAIMTTFLSVFTDSTNIPDGDGYVYSSLDVAEIDTIIDNQYLNFPGTMNYSRESVLRYALSKVGCAYDQAQHWNTTVDIFDCSSLAYRTYKDIGIDISNSGIYSAAEICREAAESGFIAYGDLQPGDLIFYGGRSNGRYLGIYHVAIYVGDGKMVEARGRSSGVVYCDVRTANIVGYSRYI